MSAERAVAGLPERIGRYEIISSLGVGGMARVYLGLQRGPAGAAKLLAIKQIRPEIAADENFLSMFADEARIALRLSHPNVVSTFDVVAEDGEFFMVLEYLEGQALSQVLRRIGRANMPLDEHLWLLTQVLSGLHYAHTLHDFDGTPLGIVHRDISPSNVFITYTGQVKLLDFGIAKASGALAETQLGIIKGKLGYASPEQCLAKPVDARSDVYAVGVMLWEALARRRRAVGETPLATIQARVQDSEASIEQVWPEVPEELSALTRAALAFDPAARIASALDLQRGLEGYAQTHARRSGQANLAQLMLRHFSGEMQERRSAVEQHVSAARVSAAQPVLRSVPTIVPQRRGPNEIERSSFTITGAVSTLTAHPPQNGLSSKTRWLLLAGLAPLLLAGVTALLMHREAAPEPQKPKPSSADAASTVETAAPSAAQAPPETSAASGVASVSPTSAVSVHGIARPRRAAPAAPTKAAAESVSVAPPPAPVAAGTAPARAEPGSDLAAHGPRRTTKPLGIDEKDPYAP